MKTTLISTVYNEVESIEIFLNSLFAQTVFPDQVVIVDAFSHDKTFSILSVYKKIFSKQFPKINFLILKKRGNRSVGRNYAIQNSTGDIIVVSDAGCILDRNWIKNIVDPFKNNKVDVVAGFYKPITNSVFEKCLSTYTCVLEEKVTKDFLPSSRSIAFKKEAWKNVGGYPEELDTCEDLVFSRNMKSQGLTFAVSKKAIVFWPQRENIWEASKQFYSYAKGDGRAHYVRRQTPILFVRILFAILLLIIVIYNKNMELMMFLSVLSILYIFWSILKNYRYVKRVGAIFYLPVLQVVSDFAVFFGMTIGFMGF